MRPTTQVSNIVSLSLLLTGLLVNYQTTLDSCTCTVKPVLSGHSQIVKTKILMTNGRLMKVESISECSLPLGAFCNTFDLHEVIICHETQFLVVLRVVVLDRFYCIVNPILLRMPKAYLS